MTTTTQNDLPAVETLPDLSVCAQPRKRIYTGDDIEPWLRSTAYRRLMSVLGRLNAAVRGQLHEEEQEQAERASRPRRPLSAVSGPQHTRMKSSVMQHTDPLSMLPAVPAFIRSQRASWTRSIASTRGLMRYPWTRAYSALGIARSETGRQDLTGWVRLSLSWARVRLEPVKLQLAADICNAHPLPA